ncbi:transglutaminase-like cysteine peptidase [Pseudovibrio exalbescens]|uniref:Transglutaminase n=1 Tax=Pseudovibrio exalbescens TaxID=197461 RepID=A0A1U7JKF1_9HYPH|nr:transglutaminase-like cysteine peptidase [Pseudovibrio exalbescens]OKL45220.1 transglutaminase [Pseudovibrio exalbescens]
MVLSKTLSAFGIGLALLFSGASTTLAETPLGRFMPVLGEATAPAGHLEFCTLWPQECVGTHTLPVVVKLDGPRWQELLDINKTINTTIKPLPDEDQFGVSEFWTYPTAGYGDCEEYVLEKRRLLIEAGWPKSALLITVVKDTNNQGHAVLSVRTNQGDLILDNQMNAILPWYSTPYRFIKRQSSRDPAKWAAISDRRVTTVASIKN